VDLICLGKADLKRVLHYVVYFDISTDVYVAFLC
jgi:hypothetical protein